MGAACSRTERGTLSVQPGNDPLTAIKDTPDGIKPDYKLGDLLGKGSFGNVYKAVHKKTHKEVAIKIMDRAKIKPTSIHREWNVLEHLGHHPYIVDYIGTYKTRDHVYFCMECMYGGELFDRLIRRGAYAEVEVRAPFRNLAHALAYLHSQGIVHRDLKPENILLSDSSEFPSMKIADFGLSQLIAPNERLLKVCGTWAYAAPEMSDPSRPGYDCRFDVFSFGVILYVVLSGTHPFDPTGDLPVNDIKARARAVQFDFNQPEWALVSDSAKDLIRRLIVKDPDQRLTSREMLSHDWFREGAPGIPTLLPPGGAGDDRGEGILLHPHQPRLQQLAPAADEDAGSSKAAAAGGEGGGGGSSRPSRSHHGHRGAGPAESSDASGRGGQRSHGRGGNLQQFAPDPLPAAALGHSAQGLGNSKGSGSAAVAPAPLSPSGASGVQISVTRSVANNAGLQPGMQMTVVAGHDGTLQLVPTSTLLPAPGAGAYVPPPSLPSGHGGGAASHQAHASLAHYPNASSGAISSPHYRSGPPAAQEQVAPRAGGGGSGYHASQQRSTPPHDDMVVVPNVLHASAEGSQLSRSPPQQHLRRSGRLPAAAADAEDSSAWLDAGAQQQRAPNFYPHLALGPDDAATTSTLTDHDHPKDDGSVGTTAAGRLRDAAADERSPSPATSTGTPPVTGPSIPDNSGGAPLLVHHGTSGGLTELPQWQLGYSGGGGPPPWGLPPPEVHQHRAHSEQPPRAPWQHAYSGALRPSEGADPCFLPPQLPWDATSQHSGGSSGQSLALSWQQQQQLEMDAWRLHQSGWSVPPQQQLPYAPWLQALAFQQLVQQQQQAVAMAMASSTGMLGGCVGPGMPSQHVQFYPPGGLGYGAVEPNAQDFPSRQPGPVQSREQWQAAGSLLAEGQVSGLSEHQPMSEA